MAKSALTPATQTGFSRFPSILALDDFEAKAKRLLPRMIYGYVSGTVETGAASRNASAAYSRISMIPRVLTNVSKVDTTRFLFGVSYSAPFGLPPMGGSAISAYEGDLELGRAAAEVGLPMIISGSALTRLEDVKAVNSDSWFQGYLAGDFERIDRIIDRLEHAGVTVLVVTGDVPVPANRENNMRNGFVLPIRMTPKVAMDTLRHPRWLFGTMGRTLMNHGMPHFENNEATRGPPLFSSRLDRNFTERDKLSWEHVAHIRKRWKGNLIIKGVLALSDVTKARELGADGVIISNHGGRQLDHAIAPLDVLPQAVADHPGFPIMIDGAIRRGTDVLKALALGAHFVFIGRPFLYAAAVGGKAGVIHGMSLMIDEIKRDMALLGITSLDQISSEFIKVNEDRRS